MPTMLEIYKNHSTEYDRLVAAEDWKGNLPKLLKRIFRWTGSRVLECGCGTGRVTEFYAPFVGYITCLDRESHMLEAAYMRLERYSDRIDFKVADNCALPDLPRKADVFIEGWSWGHSVMDADRPVAEIAQVLIDNIRRNLVPHATMILLETMGTNTDGASPPHPRLAEFYAILRERYGLKQEVITTDYRFSSVSDAAEILGFFFGGTMRTEVLKHGSATIREWTGVWYGVMPPA